MKKIFLIPIVCFFFFLSCKKDYTCQCCESCTNSNSTTCSEETSSMTEKDAKTWCEGQNTSSGSCTNQCKLK